ncbi:hypothetical protein OH76DRAFT_1520044 [Lentinus brumalis]|uniref:Uncharacterized protein n=1 Tax=Lentinus brumalis TaxID=2498619 RepID=A0A371D8E1_9APHY|nr:hypothetical protein OH76DRAFT_1520044 [Polyporus brumalis]
MRPRALAHSPRSYTPGCPPTSGLNCSSALRRSFDATVSSDEHDGWTTCQGAIGPTSHNVLTVTSSYRPREQQQQSVARLSVPVTELLSTSSAPPNIPNQYLEELQTRIIYALSRTRPLTLELVVTGMSMDMQSSTRREITVASDLTTLVHKVMAPSGFVAHCLNFPKMLSALRQRPQRGQHVSARQQLSANKRRNARTQPSHASPPIHTSNASLKYQD